MSYQEPDPVLISRRAFTRESALAILAGVSITIAGCSGSDSNAVSPTSPSPTPSPSGDVSGAVSANHGHVATITAARLASPSAIALDIRGTATHAHTVQLSADQITRIGARQQVSMRSTSDDGHDHTVTFN